MIFRKAKWNEAKTILNLYRAVIGTQFCTWDELYPGETEIAQDLSFGTLYVLEENQELIGAISIVPKNEINDFDCWKVRDNTREFARVVLRPDCQHQGLPVLLVEGVIQELVSVGVFIGTRQPYAGIICFSILVMKAWLMIKGNNDLKGIKENESN